MSQEAATIDISVSGLLWNSSELRCITVSRLIGSVEWASQTHVWYWPSHPRENETIAVDERTTVTVTLGIKLRLQMKQFVSKNTQSRHVTSTSSVLYLNDLQTVTIHMQHLTQQTLHLTVINFSQKFHILHCVPKKVTPKFKSL